MGFRSADPSDRDASRRPQIFAVGEKVRVKNEFVPGHVRMPAYIRGKLGVVVSCRRPIPSRMRLGTACRRRWSRPMTSASAPATFGAIAETTPSIAWGFSKAIWRSRQRPEEEFRSYAAF